MNKAGVLVLMVACGSDPAPARVPAATVEHRVPEAGLAVVHMTEEAELRLGLHVASVTASDIADVRTARGVVVSVSGGLALGAPATDGARQALAESTITAGAALRVAEAEEEAAAAEMDRARALLDLDASSARRLDEARGRLGRAAADVAAGRERLALLRSLATGASPANRIRVPLLGGELADLDLEAPVQVRRLGASPDAAPETTVVVPGPATSDPVAGTVDVFLAAPATVGIGEVVDVRLRRRTSDVRLAVPAGALVLDPWGGAWVYTQQAPRTYRRARVTLRAVVDGVAALDAGPPVGTAVVDVAAAELLGIEFGAGK